MTQTYKSNFQRGFHSRWNFISYQILFWAMILQWQQAPDLRKGQRWRKMHRFNKIWTSHRWLHVCGHRDMITSAGDETSSLVNGAHCCYPSFVPAEGKSVWFLNAEEELHEELMQMPHSASDTDKRVCSWFVLSECPICWTVGTQLIFSFLLRTKILTSPFQSQDENLLQGNEKRPEQSKFSQHSPELWLCFITTTARKL